MSLSIMTLFLSVHFTQVSSKLKNVLKRAHRNEVIYSRAQASTGLNILIVITQTVPSRNCKFTEQRGRSGQQSMMKIDGCFESFSPFFTRKVLDVFFSLGSQQISQNICCGSTLSLVRFLLPFDFVYGNV